MSKQERKPDRIKIEGVEGFEGEYDFALGAFTTGDLRLIKRVAGVRVNELDEAFKAGDIEVVIAVAIIALKHAGHPFWERFEEAIEDVTLETLSLTVIAGDEGDDEKDPPIQTDEPE